MLKQIEYTVKRLENSLYLYIYRSKPQATRSSEILTMRKNSRIRMRIHRTEGEFSRTYRHRKGFQVEFSSDRKPPRNSTVVGEARRVVVSRKKKLLQDLRGIERTCLSKSSTCERRGFHHFKLPSTNPRD